MRLHLSVEPMRYLIVSKIFSEKDFIVKKILNDYKMPCRVMRESLVSRGQTIINMKVNIQNER